MVISGSDGVTFPDSTTQNTTDRYGFVNRIINGDMRIVQRGTSFTISDSTATYTVDRWRIFENTDGAFTLSQDTTVPAGFTNSLKVLVTTADASVTSTQLAYVSQFIEGFNVSDFGWGTANAKTVTLSFWVRSSVTGTFGGGLINVDNNRSYPFNYSISAADTWEQKTITVAGDTTGTWEAGSGVGLRLMFSMGCGTNFQGTANQWNAAEDITVTGETQLVNTLNATWYITGVQLEVGSVATPFERRPFGTELALCQRYFQNVSKDFYTTGYGYAVDTTNIYSTIPTAVEMRTTPSFTASTVRARGNAQNITPSAITVNGYTGNLVYLTATVTGATTNQAYVLVASSTSTLSAEL
jgi:hypothetical protein